MIKAYTTVIVVENVCISWSFRPQTCVKAERENILAAAAAMEDVCIPRPFTPQHYQACISEAEQQ